MVVGSFIKFSVSLQNSLLQPTTAFVESRQTGKKRMKESVVTKLFVEDLLNNLTRSLSDPKQKSNKDWTSAVWNHFSKFANSRKWELFPKAGPYKGEYLVDFIIFDQGYGPRIAIEC
jgi:hypothetical protein